MLLGYLDESYLRGERYWLGVALVPTERAPTLSRRIRAIPASVPAAFEIPSEIELHGQALFHAKRGFRPLADQVQLRIRLFRKCLEALVASEAELIFTGVDWSGRTQPGRSGLDAHRMEAVIQLLPILEQRCEVLGRHCLLIADEEETTRPAFEEAVRTHQGTCIDRSGDCRLLDNVLFVDSRDSPGVQAADVATFLHHRIDSERDDDPRAIAANEKLWSLLQGCPIVSTSHPGP